ncbi:MAG: response regulator transcription factor [Anaerolineae bacterium]|nr:response regulator transcription factor [Anaerolineae bacterium]
MVRVLVVDDQQLIRDGIASLLSIQDGVEVVGTAADGQSAIEQAEALSPDVILMDVRMPVMDGVTATTLIRNRFPTCQVLMLTTFDDEEYIIKALRAGARGYLLKDIPIADLAQAVRLTHAGIYQLDPAVAGKLVDALSPVSDEIPKTKRVEALPFPANSLTNREIEVLRLIAVGSTNREIASQLFISEGTVKNHISNILTRLGLRDRTQAALYARDHHLI